MGEFTYEHLFDVLRRERSREELQDLEDDFYAQAAGYVDARASKARSNDVLSRDGEHARTQLQNARKLLKELYDRREKKVVLLALNKARTESAIIDTSNLLPSEKGLYDDLVDALRRARSVHGQTRAAKTAPPKPVKKAVVAEPVVEAAPPKKAVSRDTDAASVRVRITATVPKFMGSSSETFGPFESGETVSLPPRIAQILMKKGRAEQA